MPDKPSTFGLDPRRLAKIWELGANTAPEHEVVSEDQHRAERLRDFLASTPPVHPEVLVLLPDLLRRLCRELRPFLGESFGSILLDPQTDVALLKKIKDITKKTVESAPSTAEQDAATTVYYAAIASALVFHEQRITSFSYDTLREAFVTMGQSAWLTAELLELFRRAEQACADKMKKQEADG